jgi:AcrR family transcriptional regulator
MAIGKRAVYVREPWKAFQVRQRNLDEKRDAVLQTAAHLFLEQGYRRTSMGELAKRLKITKPALYHYFWSTATAMELLKLRAGWTAPW